jgi:LPPG:FO 2-phospho-L-lactate transferase
MKDLKIVALAGGVGGAKLADGLAQVMQPIDLTVIVNTGDDFSHLGLYISPDLDTVCYTLAGIANSKTGWGRNNDTWNALNELKKLGMPGWFQLGDADLATQLIRNFYLKKGLSLSEITRNLCKKWGVEVKVLPMSDDQIRTWVCTNEGDLEFQEYFVHRHCEPKVKGFRFEGVEKSEPASGVIEAISHCDVIILCPSNPWVSIDPILAIPKINSAIYKRKVYAVSPIIGSETVKGPAAKMFTELGIQPSALAVAEHYKGLIHCVFIDHKDQNLVSGINRLGIRAVVADILMRDHADRKRLAQELINVISKDIEG